MTSEIIKLSIYQEIQERAVGRDELDRFSIDGKNVEVYLKQLIVWIRILVSDVLLFSLGTIFIWNVFAPTSKDVWDRVIVKLLNGINSGKVAALVAEGDSGRFSSTSTITPNGSK